MKYIFTRFTFFFILLLSCYTGFAQNQTGTISGTLRFEDKRPVSDALVFIKNTQIHTVSNEKGYYELVNIPYGNYQLEVRTVEAKESVFSINVDKSKISFSPTLQERGNELNEVVVKAKTKEKEIETKGFAVKLIETKKVALQSIQTNELLDRTAAVRIRQDGGLGSHTHYNINGMTGNAIKIFIDGIPASNYGQSFSLNSIPPALIERIEVYKGVLPGYLSEDALGGAINIVMKENKANTLNASYSFGSFNTHRANLNGSYRANGGFGIDASGFYNYSDNNYKVWGEEISFREYDGTVISNQKAKRFHDAFKSYGTKIDMGWSYVPWADKFTIGGVFSHSFKEMQNGVTMQRVIGDRHSKRNAAIATLSYIKRDLFTEGLDVKLDASYSHLKTQVIDTVGIMYDWRGPILYPDGTPVRYSSGAEISSQKTAEINKDKTFVARANISYRLNDKNTIYTNYLFNNFDRGITDEFLPLGLQNLLNTRDLRKSIFTLTYENVAFSDRLTSNIFYKYYYQKVTQNEPYMVTETPPVYDLKQQSRKEDYNGFGATLSFELTPQIQLLGSAERAIRFPNEREIFGNPALNLNPGNVKAEKSFNANIGVNLGTYKIADIHAFRLNTSLFYRDTEGMIREGITPGNSGTSYYENLEDVLTKGIDAEFIYDYDDDFNLTFNISKFDVLFNTKYDKTGAEYLFYRQQIRNEPSFKFNINAGYFVNNLFLKGSRTSFFYNISYVEGFLRNWSNVGANNLDKIPTQFANDVSIVYTFPSQKVTVSFDAKNIFNRQLFDNFGLQKPGRAFFGKVTYSIL